MKINKRIGTIDVGAVFDRDKSLKNITRDSRLGNRPGPNPESVLGRFMAKVNSAEGFSRPNRFYVNIIPPKVMHNPHETFLNNAPSTDEFRGFPNLHKGARQLVRDVQAFCSKIEIPDRKMTQKSIQFASSPARKFVNDVEYADITATFYCDKLMLTRNFFEMWQQAAYNTESHNFEYYDNYVGHIEIFQLGNFLTDVNSGASGDDICNAIRLWDCFPTSVGSVNLGFDQKDAIGTITVTFSYRYWENYAIDNDGQLSKKSSKMTQNPNSIYEGVPDGIIGGIAAKLPPILRRPFRNAAQQLSVQNPLLAILNGRISSPFGDVSLNTGAIKNIVGI
tara:strand:- start:693 stop:1700 length:1008 start_codon:yes stop_codon:yes gene_type:complete